MTTNYKLPTTNSSLPSLRPYQSEAGRAVLEPRGEAGALRERMLTIYEAANEDPGSFKVTSRYIVATARRP